MLFTKLCECSKTLAYIHGVFMVYLWCICSHETIFVYICTHESCMVLSLALSTNEYFLFYRLSIGTVIPNVKPKCHPFCHET